MKMTHKAKLKLARKLSGSNKNVFVSPEWEARKARIAREVEKREAKSKEMAEARRLAKQQVSL